MRCVEPGCSPLHDVGGGDTLRVRARGLAGGHPAEDREGAIRHELRQLVHSVQPRQGHRDQDAGRQPITKTDHWPDIGSPLDDIQESTHHQPSQTGFSTPQGTLASSFS